MSNKRTSTKGLSPEEIQSLVEQNKGIYHEHFSPEYAYSIEVNIFDGLFKYYFRPQFIGFENFPGRRNAERPIIFASNHSGMAFPWDGMVMLAGLYKHMGHKIELSLRGLSDRSLSAMRMMNPYMIPYFWKRLGGIDATSLNFETMMHFNESHVMIYPEGIQGIGKGFNNKYQLQRFATSFIRMALKYDTDIIPIATVNGEYINPYSYKVKWIDNLVKNIGLAFLPLTILLLLIPLQPWLFYFAFPAKLTYVRGKRFRPADFTNTAFSEISNEEVKEIRDKIQAQMQSELDDAVSLHGKKPYNLREFFGIIFRNLNKVAFFCPAFWPALFREHERLFKKNNGQPVSMKIGFFSILPLMLKNPLSICYFIPILGWIPLIILGYRKPKQT